MDANFDPSVCIYTLITLEFQNKVNSEFCVFGAKLITQIR